MHRITFISLIFITFLSCKVEDYETGYVFTGDVTEIKGNTAIGHGDVKIENKGNKKELSIRCKGIIYSTDQSALQISSHTYYKEGLYDNRYGLFRYELYHPVSPKASIEDFGYAQYDGWADFHYIGGEGTFDCLLKNLQYNTTYFVRAFAHITDDIEDTEKKTYVYGEIKEFVSGENNIDPSVFISMNTVGIGVLKEDLPGLYDPMPFNFLYLTGYFTFGGYRDWRLPTLNELHEIYNIKDQMGNFNADKYWSSNYHDDIYYYYLDFSNGNTGSMVSSYGAYVRLVRTLP